jgi:hypothetical protein
VYRDPDHQQDANYGQNLASYDEQGRVIGHNGHGVILSSKS